MLTIQEIETIYRDSNYTFEGVVKVASEASKRVIKNRRNFSEQDGEIFEIYAQHLEPDEKKILIELCETEPELSNIIQCLVRSAFSHGYKSARNS